MPFDFDDYQKRCNAMTTEQLNQQWDSYTRQIAGGSTSTATSILLAAFTGGVSLVGLGFSAPRIHNARKKRQIIQASLEAQGETHHTHAKDVLIPMTIVGVAGGVTLGLGVSGVDLIPAGGGLAHSAVDYFAAQAAASGSATYFKYRATEAAKKTEEEMFEAGIQIAHTWPQGQAVQEKFGPQCPPMLHSYSEFGHPSFEAFEEPFVPIAQPNVPLPAQPNDQIQNVHSLSWPAASSTHNIRRKQVARTQSEVQKIPQSIQNVNGKPTVIDVTVQPERDTASPVTISDAELDALVAVLTDDEQLLLLMRLELELRSPGGLQPLQRSKAVHESHGRQPHIKHHGERTASQSSETELTSPSPTSHRFSVQLSDGPSSSGNAAPALPTRHHTLPLRPSQTSQNPPLPPRAPSMPGQLDSSSISATMSSNPEIESFHILRKPLFMSPQQSYTAEPVLLQPRPSSLKDERKDSGYYSASSPPSIAAFADVPPDYTPQSFSEQKQRGSQSSISSATSPPPPPYYSPPSSSAALSGGKDDCGQATAPNTVVFHHNDHGKDIHSYSTQRQGLDNILGIFGLH